MNPIKMNDGNLAYPIESPADLQDARSLGCSHFEFTACGCAYTLAHCGARDSGGWIATGMADHHARTGGRLRGVRSAKPTLWQRIKGWFA